MNKPSKFLTIAQEAAKAAEVVILEVYSKIITDFTLKTDLSPVTEADQQAEQIIRNHISKAFPDHGFLGEEFGNTNPSAKYTWVIDPIDGTKNFIRHVPFFGTEIALMRDDHLILGVSNLPGQQQMSWAEKGFGAFCNGVPLHVSQTNTLASTYLSFGNLKYFEMANKTSQLTRLANDCFQARSLGDSFSYHYLAKGSIDVVAEGKISFWDIAAVSVIVEAAGGIVTELTGTELTRESTSILAANPALHDKILNYFKGTNPY